MTDQKPIVTPNPPVTTLPPAASDIDQIKLNVGTTSDPNLRNAAIAGRLKRKKMSFI